jgi:glycosyltransferase involved in cell wall biosynthesis
LPSGLPANRQNLILTVGAIQKRKNIARLVKAFERTPAGWRLAIAGAADGYGAAEQLDAVEKSPRRGDIDILGYVSTQQLEALYSHARVFAFPSLDEGFGMPLLDAMACGIPVVASNRSAIPEVTGDAALLVDPESVDELGEALGRLTTDSALREDLTSRGRTRAEQFPWKAAVDRTWAVYQEL